MFAKTAVFVSHGVNIFALFGGVELISVRMEITNFGLGDSGINHLLLIFTSYSNVAAYKLTNDVILGHILLHFENLVLLGNY